jgi:hypothetical protein
MTHTQCRAARRLIGLTRVELASAASIPVAKIVAYEIGVVTLGETDRKAIRRVLELGGVVFVDGEQSAVRLRTRDGSG